ncbi:hypothetical protein I302_105674 [Kwoniella bestiolae CBS 10118]|uniref:Uncharacterized protein n=1 Tax=Kwoniella bestiolae CBS 10118 TaxID=1296100 RepID=A0A1B9G1T0_9TREE|nr:hypothetical protein I302_04792 [Kwoniella bestiolae CBS 10118]OCF24982.1 hypothetical protein I302_04792 [Kwoniella bestiolae CBS 10118]
MFSSTLSRSTLRYILLTTHGIFSIILLILGGLTYAKRSFIPSLMSAIAVDLYIPTSIYIALREPSNGFLTVGKEVGYLLAQGLLLLVLGIISALSTKEEICTSIAAEPGYFGYSTKPFRCDEKLALSILSFFHLLVILSWLALLFISVHKYRGHKKPNEMDGFEIPVHHFLKYGKPSSTAGFDEEHDSTPIESLTKRAPFSPFSPGTAKTEEEGSILTPTSALKSERHTSEPWRISSLPLPDLKFHFDSARNSAKSTASNAGGGFGFSFSNPVGGGNKKSSTTISPTLESARNSVKSWKRDDDLESMRRDHKRIESWRISPIPLPDLNLGFDTKSTKTHHDKDKDRSSVKSGLSGLTLEDARNSIQSIKSTGARDSLKSQVSIKPVEKAYHKAETLDVPSLRGREPQNTYRSTFQFRPELVESHRDSIETLQRDPRKVESWRISPIPLPNIRMSFDHQKKEARVVPALTTHDNENVNDEAQLHVPGSELDRDRVRGSEDSTPSGDLGLGGLGVGVNPSTGILNKRLSNVRNSTNSGFSLQHARQSVRSQIGEVLETQVDIDGSSVNSKEGNGYGQANRQSMWGDSYSSLGFGKSTFSVNFDGGSKRDSGVEERG